MSSFEEAHLLTADGLPLAAIARHGIQPRARALADLPLHSAGHEFGEGFLSRLTTVELRGEIVGYVYSRTDTAPLRDRARRTLLDTEWKRDEKSTPLHQVRLVSWWQPSRRLELDSVVTAYSRNRGHDLAPWVRWDLRAGVHLSPELELMLLGQNLLRSDGLEWRGNLQEIESRPGRTFFVGLSWRND